LFHLTVVGKLETYQLSKESVLNTFVINKGSIIVLYWSAHSIPAFISWTAYLYTWRGIHELYWILIWLWIHRLTT